MSERWMEAFLQGFLFDDRDSYECGEEYREAPVEAGSLVRVKGSVHNFENRTDDTVSFTVFRMVPDGEDKSSIIKHDRTVVEG